MAAMNTNRRMDYIIEQRLLALQKEALVIVTNEYWGNIAGRLILSGSSFFLCPLAWEGQMTIKFNPEQVKKIDGVYIYLR